MLALDPPKFTSKALAIGVLLAVAVVFTVIFVINHPNQNSQAITATSVSPNAGPTAGGQTITITGSGFKPAITEQHYVKSGLVGMWDAINNTGSGHSATTTSWKDLVGTNNLTLINFAMTSTSGWTANSLYFDGTNDYVEGNNPLYNGVGGKPDMTVEVMSSKRALKYGALISMNNTVNVEGYMNIWTALYDNRPYETVYSYCPEHCKVVADNNLYSYRLPTSTYPLGSVKTVSYGKDGTSYFTYLDGSLEAEANYTIADGNVVGWRQNTFRVGASYGSNGTAYPTPDPSFFFNGSVNNLRLYNRALSAAEMSLNSQIDQTRFRGVAFDYNANTTVTIGGVAATNVNVVNDTTITATTPAHAAGKVNVVVNSIGTTVTITNGYTYDSTKPTITLNPNSGSGNSIKVKLTASDSGSGLAGLRYTETNSATNPFTNLTTCQKSGTAITTDSSITVNTTGTRRIYACAIDNAGNYQTATGTYTIYTTPTITAVSPTQGLTEITGQVITITGTSFTNATSVTVGGEACSSFTITNSTTISCTLPSFGPDSTGVKDVLVTTPGGTSSTNANAQYTVIAQYISLSASPNVPITVSPNHFSSNKSTVTVSTNSPGGYNLMMSVDSADLPGQANLTRSTTPFDTIPTIAGYTATLPASSTTTSSLIGNNSFWAYRVNNSGSFGTTTTPEHNSTTTAYSWATIPTIDTIIKTGTMTDNLTTNIPQDTDVWFGVSPTYAKTSGNYMAIITFTGVRVP
jgi:hypothetical protein